MNLELLRSIHFQLIKPTDNNQNPTSAHALRFAPLEHLLDIIDQNDMQSFIEDIQRFTDIILATMTARVNLSTIVSNYENLIPIPISHWAGIGGVRYIPSSINPSEINDISAYEINTIQAELARQLQTNDSAFSLGGGPDEHDSMLYLRLGMIKKREDLEILLQKISDAGKETETSLKYVEDMAEKIKVGIEKVQKDLQHENLQLLAQEGLLRQLPLVSSKILNIIFKMFMDLFYMIDILSWWSPAPSASPLATKGRSFDLNSGQVESTEDTYVYRMQIKKQSPHAPTHNGIEMTSSNSDNTTEQNTTG
jgi:hypothetical protein